MTYERLNNDLVYGKGYFSEGKFKAKILTKITPEYTKWTNMLARCYSYKYQDRNSSFYKDCSVCEQWLNFQEFAKWYTSQPNYGKPRYCLDKDLTVLGSNIYSPETAFIVNPEVNSCIKLNHWGSSLPQGVSCYTSRIVKTNNYIMKTPSDGKIITKKGFSTPEEAFAVYKEIKELEIKRIANKYKHEISEKIYHNLMNFDVQAYPERNTSTNP